MKRVLPLLGLACLPAYADLPPPLTTAPVPASGAYPGQSPPPLIQPAPPAPSPTPAAAPANRPDSCPGCRLGGNPPPQAAPAPAGGVSAPGGKQAAAPVPRDASPDGGGVRPGKEIKDPTIEPRPGKEIKDPTIEPRPGKEIKDPTIEPRRFREAWKQMVPANPAKGAGAAGKSKVPDIRLIGKILGPGRPPTVMLLIEKQTYVVQQGGQISVLGQSKDPVTVRVESAGPAGVGLLLLPSGERLNLN